MTVTTVPTRGYKPNVEPQLRKCESTAMLLGALETVAKHCWQLRSGLKLNLCADKRASNTCLRFTE